MKISKRLQAVADFIPKKAYLLDVGCDHALLDIYLVLKKVINKVIVTDISKGAIEQANKNIINYGLENEITTKLGDGLEALDNKVNTISISGLGGYSIINILLKDKIKLKNINAIIVQPNNNSYFLRKRMKKIGFYIEKESLIKDNNIIYPTILFKRGNKKYSNIQCFFGPVLLKNKNKLFLEFYNNELKKLIVAYKQIPNKYLLKKIFMKIKINIIAKIIK